MDLLGALAAANALNVTKLAVAADKAVDKSTLMLRIADAEIALANVKIAQLELQAENIRLHEEIKRLLEADGAIDELVEVKGYRYQKDPEGAAMGFPACPSCLTNDKAVAIMVQKGARNGAVCPRCSADFDPVTSFVAPGVTRVQKRKDDRARSSALMNVGGTRHWSSY